MNKRDAELIEKIVTNLEGITRNLEKVVTVLELQEKRIKQLEYQVSKDA